MRAGIVFMFLMLVAVSMAPGLQAQGAIEAPEGFTMYSIEGPGINAPPLPFKIEGDQFVAPEGGMVTVTESHLTDDRVDFKLQVPGADVHYVGVRDGEVFAGFGFVLEGDQRDVAPVSFIPVGQTAAIEPDPSMFASAPGISRIEVVPGEATLEPGQPRRFVARVYDDSGNEVTDSDVEWFVGGSRTRIDTQGEVVSLEAGTKQIVALVNGAIGMAEITVLDPKIDSLTIFNDVPGQLAVGSQVTLELDGMNSVNRWVLDPEVDIRSSAPEVIAIEGHTLVAQTPGRATVTLQADQATAEYSINVVRGSGRSLSIAGVPAGAVRTGDVVQLSSNEEHAHPVWSVAEPGAEVYADGSFVAERPGRYTIIAMLGDRVATSSIEAESRGVAGKIHMNGHGENTETYTADLWPQNSYVYVGTHQANQLRTYDVSDPSSPVLTDQQEFDARVINDVKVSEDGRWLVATREGAANRRNGILVFSLENPAQPELVSEYTETLTSGVHNVFWVGELVYAVNDGTGDMHIIDVSDPVNPTEVGRWGLEVEGRSLHDVWVQDGVAYLSYLRDGLVILDVGGGGQGGTPSKPVQLSRIFYPGGPTHSAMRYGDYVFVGDEDFSLQGTVPAGSDPRGPVHVVDVSDVANPKYVARYEVPEAGAHNFWIDDGVLYIGYYQGGIRAVDVSGTLRGDLYAQGREIAHFLPAAGPEDAKKPYETRVWGVFPMFGDGWSVVGDMLYATDYNSGLWSFTVELPEKPIS